MNLTFCKRVAFPDHQNNVHEGGSFCSLGTRHYVFLLEFNEMFNTFRTGRYATRLERHDLRQDKILVCHALQNTMQLCTKSSVKEKQSHLGNC
jgi:hypothetical protein